MPTIASDLPSETPSPARQALLDAALTLFLQKGFAASRVDDIALKAGISKGAVYLHYATKEALFRGVVEEGVLAQLERAEQLLVGFNGSATGLLSTMLHTNLLEYWGSPSSGIMKLVVAESQQFPGLAEGFYDTITGRARQLLIDILQLGIDQGEFRALDVPYTARCILNALDHELIMAHSLSPEVHSSFDPHRYIDTLLQLITGGVSQERKV